MFATSEAIASRQRCPVHGSMPARRMLVLVAKSASSATRVSRSVEATRLLARGAREHIDALVGVAVLGQRRGRVEPLAAQEFVAGLGLDDVGVERGAARVHRAAEQGTRAAAAADRCPGGA